VTWRTISWLLGLYSSRAKLSELEDLPYNHDDEIQHVPAVSHIRILVHHQTISDNLQKGLDCENDEEGIFNCFLKTHKMKTMVHNSEKTRAFH